MIFHRDDIENLESGFNVVIARVRFGFEK